MTKRISRSTHQYRLDSSRGKRRFRRLRSDPVALALVRRVGYVRGVPLTDILRVTRGNATISDTRQLAMYLVHVQLGRPQSEVAYLFGRDRTTVAHACHKVEDRRDHAAIEAQIERIETAFNRDLVQVQARVAHVG